MNKFLDKCLEYADERKIAVAAENGKKYTLNNTSGFTIEKYRVDGCIAQPERVGRCDFLFLTKIDGEPKTAYFVELKGGKPRRAIEQIRDTLKYLKNDLPSYTYRARIVGYGGVADLKILPSCRELLQLLGNADFFHHATNKNFSETI